jgi:hypothetical protein
MRKLTYVAAALALVACGGRASAAPSSAAPRAHALAIGAGQPWFSANGITYLPVGTSAYPGGEDWYALCTYDAQGTKACKRLVPAWSMKGIQVNSEIGADGRTPLTLYAQTEMYAGQDVSAMSDADKVKLAKSVLDRQSAAIAVFEARLAGAIAQFDAGCAADVGCETAASALRSGRAPASSARAKAPGAKTDAEPEPRHAALAGGKRLQDAGSVDVPGQRPDPEYPTFDPNPPDPSAPDGSPDPGAAGEGGMPDQPDGSGGWRRYRAPSETCVALPPLPGLPAVAAGCTVTVPAPKPVPSPDTQPLPRPATDWCQMFPGMCANADGLPPNVPNPMRDMCNSRFVLKAMHCFQERLDHPDTVSDTKTRLCVAGAQAQLALCVTGAPPLRTSARQ